MSSQRWPKWTGGLLRGALCLALLAGLIHRVDLPTLRSVGRDACSHPGWLAAGAALSLLALGMAALRWLGILRVQGFALSAARVTRVFLIGQFFNAFMLGACGGDVARIFYTIRESTQRRAEAATTVLIDRGLGLLAQVVCGCGLILWQWPLFRATGTGRAAALLLFLLLAGALLVLVLLLRKNLFEHFALFQRLEQRSGPGRLIRRAYETFYLYRRRPAALAGALGFSLLNLFFQIAACACLGRSLEIDRPLTDYLAFLPAISVLTAIPLTPGSFGVREGLFVVLFRSVGVDGHRALLLALLFYLSGIVWGLLGGVLFLGHSAGPGRSLRAEFASIRRSAARGPADDA